MAISQNFPTTRPSLTLDFAKHQELDPRVTFTRASSATRVSPDGLIETIPADEPRFDFDPVTGECLGLLIEEQRTNLSLNSQDFTDNTSLQAWPVSPTTSRAYLISNTGIDDPSGGTTASRWASGTTNSEELIYHLLPAALTVGVTYTASVWIRRVSGTGNVNLMIGDNAGSSVSSQLDSFPVGTWVRCSATRTVTGVNGSAVRGYILVYPDALGNPTTIDIWGYQMEQGSFPTSYIPTSGSTVTRTADNASITGSNFTDFYNPSEGTVYVRYNIKGNFGVDGYNRVFEIGDGTSNNRLTLLSLGATDDMYDGWIVNGIGEIQFNTINTTYNAFYKWIAGYKQNDFQRYSIDVNGALDSNTDTTIDVSSFTANQLNIGYEASSTLRQLNGHISQLIYYPVRLTNSQLQTLTK